VREYGMCDEADGAGAKSVHDDGTIIGTVQFEEE